MVSVQAAAPAAVCGNGGALQHQPLPLQLSDPLHFSFLFFLPPLLFAEHQTVVVHITRSRAVGKK